VAQSWFHLGITDQPVVGQSWFELQITDEPVGAGAAHHQRPPGFVMPVQPEIVTAEIPVRVATRRTVAAEISVVAIAFKRVRTESSFAVAVAAPVHASTEVQAELSRMVVLLREDEEFLLGMM
jgi:hypothetical protein